MSLGQGFGRGSMIEVSMDVEFGEEIECWCKRLVAHGEGGSVKTGENRLICLDGVRSPWLIGVTSSAFLSTCYEAMKSRKNQFSYR